MSSRFGLHLNSQSSYWSIYRAQELTYDFSRSFRASKTFKVTNPRNHIARGDKLSITLRTSAVAGLQDEAILALLTKGYFGGWMFSMEGLVMRSFGGVLPAKYEAFKDKPNRKIIWWNRDIPKYKLVSVGDMFFDFMMLDKHIKTSSDQLPSYVDYGFGSDARPFSGSHRFVVERREYKPGAEGDKIQAEPHTKEGKEPEGVVELYVECFRCNPKIDRDSWAERMPWLHYWYGKLLWAESVRTVLRR